jgi:hypothetical protein
MEIFSLYAGRRAIVHQVSPVAKVVKILAHKILAIARMRHVMSPSTNAPCAFAFFLGAALCGLE